jgi:SAM-dependent methyltransferase
LHPSAHAHMALCVERYLEKGRRYRVLDLGSRTPRAQKLTHRQLLAGYDVDYTGVDIRKGRNVDMVMKKPYRIPVKSGAVDVVFSGQAFEHIAFPWASMLEIARVLTSGGLAFITAPSRGHKHGRYDCWRYYPDGMRALAAWARLETLEAHTDFPPVVVVEGVNGRRVRRYDYAQLDANTPYYWGDSVGVFRKPIHYNSFSMAIVRSAVRWWANRAGGISDTPTHSKVHARDDVLGTGHPVTPAP